MSCAIGEMELYYEDGERHKCPTYVLHPADCCLSLTDTGFKCCLRSPGEEKTFFWKCIRVTLGGNVAQRYLKTGELSEFTIDRFKLTFFKRQILEEVEKVRHKGCLTIKDML